MIVYVFFFWSICKHITNLGNTHTQLVSFVYIYKSARPCVSEFGKLLTFVMKIRHCFVTPRHFSRIQFEFSFNDVSIAIRLNQKDIGHLFRCKSIWNSQNVYLYSFLMRAISKLWNIERGFIHLQTYPLFLVKTSWYIYIYIYRLEYLSIVIDPTLIYWVSTSTSLVEIVALYRKL